MNSYGGQVISIWDASGCAVSDELVRWLSAQPWFRFHIWMTDHSYLWLAYVLKYRLATEIPVNNCWYLHRQHFSGPVRSMDISSTLARDPRTANFSVHGSQTLGSQILTRTKNVILNLFFTLSL